MIDGEEEQIRKCDTRRVRTRLGIEGDCDQSEVKRSGHYKGGILALEDYPRLTASVFRV